MLQLQSLMGSILLGQAAPDFTGSQLLIQHLIAVVVFSAVGVVVFALSMFIIEKLTPFSIIKEIGEEQNVAVAVLVGAIVLGISIIIGASILGWTAFPSCGQLAVNQSLESRPRQ